MLAEAAARPLRSGLLLVAIAAVLWGTGGAVAKALFATTSITPLAVGFFRLAFSVPVLLLAGWWLLGPRLLRVPKPQLAGVAAVSLAMALYQVFYYAAVYQAGVVIATLVTLCGAPILVAILSAVLLRERPGVRVVGALVLALAGTALLVGLPGDVGAGPAAILLGAALASGSALSYAVLTVASRALAAHCHPFQLIVIGFGGGALMLLPFTLWQGLTLSHPPEGWLLLVYLGLVPTAVAYGLFFTGMRTTAATPASIASLMEPLTATLLAWMLFDERLGPLGTAGAVLLLGSLFVVHRESRRSG